MENLDSDLVISLTKKANLVLMAQADGMSYG